MKVLITGALGNVGRFVTSSLLDAGEQVVLATRSTTKARAVYGANPNVDTVDFDLLKPSTFATALRDVNRVFLMRPPQLGKAKDLLPFIEALAQEDIQLVAFLSLMGVEKNPIPPHYKIEKLIEKYGIPYSHIRPGFFMQNLSGIHAEELRQQSQIYIPAGNSRTSFIDAADVGRATATVLQNPSKYRNTAHTLTGPEALDYYQVADILSEVLGRKITYQAPSMLSYRRRYIKQRGLNAGYVNVTMMLYLMTRLGTASKVTTGFTELTGEQPRTLREFALDNLAAWRQ